MATDKRERQRQNRASKQQQDGKVARKRQTIAMAKRIAKWAVAGVVFIFLANTVWG